VGVARADGDRGGSGRGRRSVAHRPRQGGHRLGAGGLRPGAVLAHPLHAGSQEGVRPRLRPGGALLALKGMRAQAEVDDAKYVIKKAKLSVAVIHEIVTAGDETTAVVEIRRPKNR